MTKRMLAWAVVIVLGFAAAIAAGYWLGTRGAATAESPQAAAGSRKDQRRVLYYRNPMGLPDTSPVPKKDPMGMDYLPVYEGETGAGAAPAGTVRIAPEKQQVMGVRTEPVSARDLRRIVRAVGTIQPNERLVYRVSPRFEGWIEKLHVNTTGQSVARGQPLMEVYSPELVSAQEEYLIALRAVEQTPASGPEAQAVMRRLAESALRRMRNFGVSEAELDLLRREGKARQTLTYRSPAAGVVTQKPSVQGMRFMPGELLYEIADFSTVWMVADVSERELGLAKVGQAATLKITAYPEKAFDGKVVFIQPTLDAETRTARVRVELRNPGGLLKPAMYGEVELSAGHPRGKVLAVPDSAVLDSGAKQAVLVQRAAGLFEPREVKLGMRAEGYAEVLEGLRAGEEVVVRANFLIDAESNLKAALQTFGADAGHRGSGKIAALDAQAGTVELDHEAMPSLGWPAMTMEFKVADRSLLSGLKTGDRIDFEVSAGEAGKYVIRRVAPAKPKPPAAAQHQGH
jgi:membrane fusion protein, copper/silver efflux system